MISRLFFCTLSDFVFITIPSATCVLHEGASLLLPSISTTQSLQPPKGNSSLSSHRVGISIPACLQASNIVYLSGTTTFLLSIVRATSCIKNTSQSYLLYTHLLSHLKHLMASAVAFILWNPVATSSKLHPLVFGSRNLMSNLLCSTISISS